MPEKCVLETYGYQATFFFTRDERLEGDFDVAVEFSLCPELGSISVKSISGRLNVEALHALVAYFDNHVEALKKTRNPKSIVFFTEALNFSFQALAGHFTTDTEGVWQEKGKPYPHSAERTGQAGLSAPQRHAGDCRIP